MSILSHTRRIGLLIVWATLIQGLVIVRNPVPAQDAVGFIQFARQLDHHSITEALRSNTQHPLYPVLVWAQHAVLGLVFGSGEIAWVRSAQFVAAFAFVLLIIPMYVVGNRLANARFATASVALFCVLPVAARMGADALADSTYLLFMLMALLGCVEFLESRRLGWLVMAGVATGTGYLARPEALIMPLAMAATLLVLQLRPSVRLSWRRLVAAAACGIAGLLSVAAPYTIAIGKLTPKRSLNFLPGGQALFARFDTDLGRPATRSYSDGSAIPESNSRIDLPRPGQGRLDFALNHRPSDKRWAGYLPAGVEVLKELIQGLHYLPAMFLLIGIFFTQRKPANVLCSALSIVFLLILVQFASKSGYVASRHVLTLVCLACYAAPRGAWVMAGWFANMWSRNRFTRWGFEQTAAIFEMRQRRIAMALSIVTALLCLPRALGSLHQSRSAHVAAGQWLFEHAEAGSIVLDSRGWASLYSGLPAYDYNGARLAFENPDLAYVVVESEELADDRPRGETLRHLLGVAGHIVAEFPAGQSSSESVKIFAWHPERVETSRSAVPAMKAN